MIERVPTPAILCLLCVFLSACDMDFGFALGGVCENNCGMVAVEGDVFVDGYRVEPGEAVMELYAPDDTLTPLPLEGVDLWGPAQDGSETQLPLDGQGYYWNFGVDPDPAVCSYMARVILWNGIPSGVRPLFANPSVSCASDPARHPGATFELPGYGEDEERWVEGTVWVDGELAGADEVAVEVHVRRRDDEAPVAVTTDEQGTYRVALDGPQWFVACRRVTSALAKAGSEEASTEIGGLAAERCGERRRLHDVRFGQRLVALGQVSIDGEPAGEGGAWVRLLDPADSTVVGDTVWTYDDGSYRLHLPLELQDPAACDWLIEAALAGGTPAVWPLQASFPCPFPASHDVELTPG